MQAMPDRIEAYCGGHLIKRIDQIDVGPAAGKPYSEFVDGRYRWFIGDAEVSEEVAEALIRGWDRLPAGVAVPEHGARTSHGRQVVAVAPVRDRVAAVTVRVEPVRHRIGAGPVGVRRASSGVDLPG